MIYSIRNIPGIKSCKGAKLASNRQTLGLRPKVNSVTLETATSMSLGTEGLLKQTFGKIYQTDYGLFAQAGRK
jgi:hypothetical protein